MTDFNELMQILSVPRPAGSRANENTRRALLEWCERRKIAYRLHGFRLYPYFFTAIGIWLVATRLLLALAVGMRWGWGVLAIALVGLTGGLIDYVWNIPLVSWMGARQSQNILVVFEPRQARQEIVLSAHYDSKTEPLDHRQRMIFVKNMPLGILLTALLGILGPLDRILLDSGSAWANFTFGAGLAICVPVLFLTLGMGLNLALGRLSKNPSRGAVDNGSSCAILLGLAERLQESGVMFEQTRLTLALFDGEEVSMQGSRAYVKSRDWSPPVMALNLEIMAQDGATVYWEEDGISLKMAPTSPEVNQRIRAAVEAVTGQPAQPGGPINSDGGSFLKGGIPSSTLGTYDLKWKERGLHQASDNMPRVVIGRLAEGVEILLKFVKDYDEMQVDGIER